MPTDLPSFKLDTGVNNSDYDPDFTPLEDGSEQVEDDGFTPLSPEETKTLGLSDSSGYSEVIPPESSLQTGIMSRLKNFALSANQATRDFFVGQAKGVASTALNMGQLGSKVMEMGYEKTIGKAAGAIANKLEETDLGPEALPGMLRGAEHAQKGSELAASLSEKYATPTDLAQAIGFGTEKAGELLAPLGTSKAGAMVTEKLLTKGTTLPMKTMNVAARVGVGTVADVADVALKTMLQSGAKDPKKTEDAIIMTAILGPIFRTGTAIRQEFGPDIAARVVNSLVKPKISDLAYGKNPGKEIAKEGITGWDFDELGTKIAKRKSEIGSKIGDILAKNANKNLDVSKALNPIDDALREAMEAPRTNAALITRLQNIKSDIMQEVVDEGGISKYGRQLTDLKPLDVNILKQDVGEMTKFTGSPSDDQLVNKALQRVYGNLKGEVESAVPGIQALNEKWGNLHTADMAVRYRGDIAKRLNLLSLPSLMVGGAGALVTSMLTGGNALKSTLVGLGAASLDKMLGSPIVKTSLGSWLANAPSAEKEEVYKAIPGIVSTLQKHFDNDLVQP